MLQVATKPRQVLSVHPGRIVAQSPVAFADGMFLVRVFIDMDHSPPTIVTAYRTSKMTKYWSDTE